ncbi:MAG: 2-C-methyl-D-erythritol 2,4-cyclodiphosphate synthase [Chlamydiales bacterium]|nr:2-C-methyl-D-erythritol 2,4-cyclodiphosphate synthase [Chlamydiales bacterium]
MKNEIPYIRTGIGQKSHRFLPPDSTKPCVIAGIIFADTPGFQSRSDGDVVFGALCNAISSLTGVPILSEIALKLRTRDGITDSEVYVKEAVKTLKSQKITHVAISLEAKRPYFQDHLPEMKKRIAQALSIQPHQVGITAISGAGLTDCGCGDGVSCTVILTTSDPTGLPSSTLF